MYNCFSMTTVRPHMEELMGIARAAHRPIFLVLEVPLTGIERGETFLVLFILLVLLHFELFLSI